MSHSNNTTNKWISSLNLLLLALLSYVVAQIAWQAMSDQVVFTPPPSVMLQKNSAEPVVAVSELARRVNGLHPFGQADAKPIVVESAPVIEAPETKLNYKLRGIYFSTNKELASAIIVTKNNQSKSFQVDDEIEKGITLHDINVDSVVLNRYGKFETLSLEKKKLKNQANTSVVARSTNPQQTQVLRQYKQRFVNNPMALAKRFRAIPVTNNGRNIGFKLQAVGGETLLKKLDVPKDAVFTAINGVSLAKPFQALDALKSLQTAKQVTVTFQLNGVEQTRNFEL